MHIRDVYWHCHFRLLCVSSDNWKKIRGNIRFDIFCFQFLISLNSVRSVLIQVLMQSRFYLFLKRVFSVFIVKKWKSARKTSEMTIVHNERATINRGKELHTRPKCYCACGCYICVQCSAAAAVSSSSFFSYLGIFLKSAFLFDGFGVNQISRSFSTPSKNCGFPIFSFSAILIVNIRVAFLLWLFTESSVWFETLFPSEKKNFNVFFDVFLSSCIAFFNEFLLFRIVNNLKRFLSFKDKAKLNNFEQKKNLLQNYWLYFTSVELFSMSIYRERGSK